MPDWILYQSMVSHLPVDELQVHVLDERAGLVTAVLEEPEGRVGGLIIMDRLFARARSLRYRMSFWCRITRDTPPVVSSP
eukprot:7753546-Heterocapsa_arctica.AAC.1